MRVFDPRHKLAFALAIGAGLSAFWVTVTRYVGVDTVDLFRVQQASFASLLVEITLFSALVASLLSFQHYLRVTRRKWLDLVLGYFIRLSVSLSITVLWTGIAVFLLSLSANVLRTQHWQVGTSAVFAALYAALLTFVIARFSARLTGRSLLQIGILTFAFGIGVAGLFASDSRWLTDAISFLGASEAAIAFNLAFILAGFLLMALMVDMMDDLATLRERGFIRAPHLEGLRFLLVFSSLMLSGVGIFIYEGATLWLHNLCAHAALVCFILAMLVTPQALPFLGERLRFFSYLAALICLFASLGYLTGAWSFSAMELLLLGVAILWISLLQNYAVRFVQRLDRELADSLGLLPV